MVRIVRHRALSIDALRQRFTKARQKPRERACPTCAGSGEVSDVPSLKEIAAEIGINAIPLGRFEKGHPSLNLENGLKLLTWLDDLERDKLDELDDEHDPKDPDAPADDYPYRRIRAAASEAAATAAIDARDRPLQLVGK